ncbi:MAG: peptidylprolyl isomerase [Paenibacillus dendritiformis]|uniref:peptidylprolyl isomerase n=1 Tax=Paenibacillus dendritiformis TaxID=130049 RepID=UPI001B13675B|nr:peptidylprolyl isomerase [Paenibacillus dendritiformis]MDU5142834.1 peptidylprolyl isomerase [Paenibacillus dendritiformis]GIO73553.1 peptidyl-prolyl cis-trans isomerase [Paenibacillus dendritiformis]
MRRSNRQRTGLSLVVLLMAAMLVVAGCGNASGADNAKHPLVTIEMESGKKIEVELYPDTAPNTVNNFISLVNKGFYDGLIFHRVIPGFMIQGGDPEGTGLGGPGYSIKGEFSSNGVTNELKHTEGVISMARSEEPDSAGSQFFIMDANAPHLDGQYAAFGKVTSGIETVHEIANAKRGANDRPVEEQKIKKITVDTFGVEYKEPETSKEPERK